MSLQSKKSGPSRKVIIDRLLTMDEVANILGVKKSTIYQWVHLGFIPVTKAGRLNRFRKEDIERFIHSRTRKESCRYRHLL